MLSPLYLPPVHTFVIPHKSRQTLLAPSLPLSVELSYDLLIATVQFRHTLTNKWQITKSPLQAPAKLTEVTCNKQNKTRTIFYGTAVLQTPKPL